MPNASDCRELTRAKALRGRWAALAPVACLSLSWGSATVARERIATPIPAATIGAVQPNDNRHAAGLLRHGVLTVHLDARMGDWRPDAEAGLAFRVAAFAADGGPLQTPGPLLRVPAGTEIRVTLTNHLTTRMWIHGMGASRGLAGEGVPIAANASRELRFRVTEPGTYYYAARTDTLPVFLRLNEDSQLGGAIVVDPPTGAAAPNDRIIVMTLFGINDWNTPSGLPRQFTVAFNGRTWPHTEHFQLTQGDSVHWRVVNLTFLGHPLHLHGFYFRVTAKGDGVRDTLYAPDENRLAVTENLGPFQTASLAWLPDRPGNWIFHCHLASHLSTDQELAMDRSDMRPRRTHNPMRGLILGLTVKPRTVAQSGNDVVQTGERARKIRLLVRSHARVYGNDVGYAFVLGGSPDEANRDAMPVPGPTLELTRGERVQFTIVNQSHDQAAIHWHGIELESYADGVPDVSGVGRRILPSIAPGDSLLVAFTPPRSGTFIYHSHSNELQQISSGLYGALLVLDPGTRRDPQMDRVMLLSDGGPMVNVVDPARIPPALLNGERTPRPIELRADTPTRVRFINIRSEIPMIVSLEDSSGPVEWKPVAKDGMPVAASQARPRPATFVLSPGETYDVELRPRAGALLALRYAIAGLPPGTPPALAQPTTVPVHVH